MIRRLTKRTELEIVAQWPQDSDLGEDSSPYVASLLGDCSPDEVGKMSTHAPESLMQLLEKYIPLISSQCRARGTLGAKVRIFLTMKQGQGGGDDDDDIINYL